MANPFFQFKQFTVYHDKCAMKVGTDGVLLGAWTQTAEARNILDIGTGTGLIALMLAQRTTAIIDAIDIDADACLQAKENSQASPFSDRIHIHHQPLASFKKGKKETYDLIVSNPPYFVHSLKSPEEKRNLARHTESLSLEELIGDSKEMLSPSGRICLILPSDQEEILRQTIERHTLYIRRRTHVIPVSGGTVKRILIELSKTPAVHIETEELVLEEKRHQYTPQYTALTQAYYLKM